MEDNHVRSGGTERTTSGPDPAQLYAELVATYNRGQWHEAERLANLLLPLAPRHAGVYSIAGATCLQLQKMTEAAGYLGRASELDPGRADFATLHAKALAIAGNRGEALLAADRALALSPADPMGLDTLGVIYTQAHAHGKAVEAFRRAVAHSPAKASLRFNLATALVAIGEVDAAEAEFENCIALDQTFWPSHLSLARLRQQTGAGNHVSRLRSLLAQHQGDSGAAIYLNMALAKELEDLGEYPHAFAHLVRGKSAARGTRRYPADRDRALLEVLTRVFQEPPPGADGHPTDEPIFVIGMPRSGTTLVERIISNHPHVYAAGELQNFAGALQRVSASHASLLADPQIAERVQALDWQRLGADYLASTRPATGHKPRFVDKLPHNFLYAGFIARALPNARIICLRRDPLDTCLGNFRQLFDNATSTFDYAFDLLDTGRHYILFDRLMAHWQRVFPGRIMEVDYEALVAQHASVTRQLLEFCGLPWHDACLHFEHNTAAVATLSAAQVRAPIYRHAVHRWKNYAAQLGDLRSLLADAGIRLST